MKRGKMIAGLIWLAVGALLVLFLASLMQKLIISGVDAINDMGALLVESGEYESVSETEHPVGYAVGDWRDDLMEEPAVTPEPEELITIPVEQTIEELAEEE